MATDKYEQRHRGNMSAYEREIDRLYRQAVAQAAALGASLHGLEEGTPFSFDDYPAIRKRVEKLLQKLHDGVSAAVLNGIRAEWELSNGKNDELARQVLGDNAGKLTQEQYRRYFSDNDSAREAFEKRKVDGLNLSDRVWRYTEQFKEEIELGLDVGIRNGLSADEMSRELRQYLKYPDKLFRRVRDEHGELKLSKRAAAFHPGRGVYRSSYKNARRLAATETNIAYRTADHERWQQFDFVVGIEIKLSKNHPEDDICNDLKGRYPKDFKFTGWHPHCRCYATSILKTEEELAEDTRRILAGEEPDGGSVNRVEDVPEGFKKWVRDNEGRYRAAEKRGTLPYFIRDNKEAVDGILEAAKGYYVPSGVDAAVRSLWEKNTAAIEKSLGIAKGKEMTFEEADELRGNPNYGKGAAYGVNCQSCVVANELRRRGFDVKARPNPQTPGSIPYELSLKTELAWIDESGNTPIKDIAGGYIRDDRGMHVFDSKGRPKEKSYTVMMREFEEKTNGIGRYHINFAWNSKYGHIITAERLADGSLRIYDPQTGKIISDFKAYAKKFSKRYGIEILKIDELRVNTSIIDGVVEKS